ncbi:hypothetical protein M5D96_013036 [Drosophila gunungcola]|uniref:Uncharacterized protein n=1 Tax=Drosophila gunungcola TaxID=103775 RepID=A0A9P9YCJ1_9MUSC|nr:hypothetical protein M5D96_013036 [Drosophila gunungcola]
MLCFSYKQNSINYKIKLKENISVIWGIDHFANLNVALTIK